MCYLSLSISNFSSKPDKKFMAIYQRNFSAKTEKLNPWYVTGFSDAESSFQIHVSPRPANKLGWRVYARFDIYLDIKELSLLYLIQAYFNGIGSIVIDKKRNKASFNVNKLEDFINQLIPHFNKYPLQSSKQIEYSLWQTCIELMVDKKHLTKDGLDKILSIKGALNKGLPENLTIEFPYIVPVEKPAFNQSSVNEPLNPYWVTGFSDGDSSFYISHKIKRSSIQATFKINLHEKEGPLLLRIKSFFGEVGNINTYAQGNSKCYIITKRSDLTNIIVHHFNKYPLVGNKLSSFNTWSNIITLMNSGEHLTPEGLSKIKLLIKRNDIVNENDD
uniref:Homing endonuclease LAGLIDADG domain-containing protein n=1 Tax=Dactylella tenuis TaxID=383872 RepID=A0A4Y5MZZ2_9PEZI|nr:hypothetical protein [Dactylella tenuis]QCW06838.1 hypothetical protein [Dactylella tenuis]